jgi:hypothetical protein
VCKLGLIVLLAALTPYASAQRSLPPHFVSTRPGAHSRPVLYPVPLFSDYLDSDASFGSGYPPEPQPAVIVMQAPAAQSEPEPVPPPVQPLLIELKGDRYVRVSGEEPARTEMIDQDSTTARKPGGQSKPTIPSLDLAPAVLVFRDGHREEVTNYTIADGVLYAQGNYYTDGSWSRRIELSSLNLPETIEVSHSRGVSFRLPAAPNEVVTRP